MSYQISEISTDLNLNLTVLTEVSSYFSLTSLQAQMHHKLLVLIYDQFIIIPHAVSFIVALMFSANVMGISVFLLCMPISFYVFVSQI
jgi:hypothetical protein